MQASKRKAELTDEVDFNPRRKQDEAEKEGSGSDDV